MDFFNRLLTVTVGSFALSAAAPRTAAAVPNCGPNEVAAAFSSFCNKFKPTFWDILASAVVPVYGLNKAALYAACKGAANAGYFVDGIVNSCCVAHDDCYSRGGDATCKAACDSQMAVCNYEQLQTLIFGWDLGWQIALAAGIGGYATFNWTGEPSCGQ